MPIAGIVCGADGSYQGFDSCIECHRNRGPRNCHFPTFALKLMRDNGVSRAGVGYSATTLLACSRAVALLEVYDYYEELESGWNKIRGELMHAVAERYPDENTIQEQRIRKMVTIGDETFLVTGKADEIDTLFGYILDYKWTAEIPEKPKPEHEAQFNIYRWLCDDGTYLDTGEPVNIDIVGGGMHYLSMKKKKKRDGRIIYPWKKIPYATWPVEQTQSLVETRLFPLTEWHATGFLPVHNPYESGFWTCDCEKITTQLQQRGIEVQEFHDRPK